MIEWVIFVWPIRNRDIMTYSLLVFLKAVSILQMDLEEFIVGAIILALLSFCMKEFIDLGFQDSI